MPNQHFKERTCYSKKLHGHRMLSLTNAMDPENVESVVKFYTKTSISQIEKNTNVDPQDVAH